MSHSSFFVLELKKYRPRGPVEYCRPEVGESLPGYFSTRFVPVPMGVPSRTLSLFTQMSYVLSCRLGCRDGETIQEVVRVHGIRDWSMDGVLVEGSPTQDRPLSRVRPQGLPCTHKRRPGTDSRSPLPLLRWVRSTVHVTRGQGKVLPLLRS